MKNPLYILALLLFLCYHALASTSYFSQSKGNDAWSGRLAQPNATKTDGPKQSIVALNAMLDNAAPGDSLLLLRGDSWIGTTGIQTTKAQGTENRPITIAAYGEGDRPKLVLSGEGNGILCRGSASGASAYLRFEHIHIHNTAAIGSQATGVYVNESFYPNKPHHLSFSQLYIERCKSGMILYQHHLVVERCTLRTNGNSNQGQGIFVSADSVNIRQCVFDSNGCGSVFVHSIYVSNCNAFNFEENEIMNADDGIKLRASENVLVRRNYIHDMYIHALHVGGDDTRGTKNIRIEANTIKNSPLSFSINSESGTQTQYSENIVVVNNIFSSLVHLSNNGPLKDVYLCNNSITCPAEQNQALGISAQNAQHLVIKNNILFRGQSSANQSLLNVFVASGLQGVEMNNNLYYTTTVNAPIIRVETNSYRSLAAFRAAYPAVEQQGQEGNPNVVSAEDLHLTAASTLAIDKGSDLSTLISKDADGMPRVLDGDGQNGAQSDIGPYEYAPPLSVGNEQNQTLSIYPNPCQDIITIQYHKALPCQLFLYNSVGVLLHQELLHTERTTLSLAEFAQGYYLLHLRNGNSNYSLSFVKE